jgi:hypothetical protein
MRTHVPETQLTKLADDTGVWSVGVSPTDGRMPSFSFVTLRLASVD